MRSSFHALLYTFPRIRNISAPSPRTSTKHANKPPHEMRVTRYALFTVAMTATATVHTHPTSNQPEITNFQTQSPYPFPNSNWPANPENPMNPHSPLHRHFPRPMRFENDAAMWKQADVIWVWAAASAFVGAVGLLF